MQDSWQDGSWSKIVRKSHPHQNVILSFSVLSKSSYVHFIPTWHGFNLILHSCHFLRNNIFHLAWEKFPKYSEKISGCEPIRYLYESPITANINSVIQLVACCLAESFIKLLRKLIRRKREGKNSGALSSQSFQKPNLWQKTLHMTMYTVVLLLLNADKSKWN